jgi:hypothetical protein
MMNETGFKKKELCRKDMSVDQDITVVLPSFTRGKVSASQVKLVSIVPGLSFSSAYVLQDASATGFK